MKTSVLKLAITAALLSPFLAIGQLQLYLPFDDSFTDGGGNLISPDASGFGRDAYLNLAATNATYGISGAAIVPGGVLGSGLQLDGVNDFARVLNWSGVSGNGARSIVMWVKESSSTANPNDIWVGWGSPGTSARVRWDFGLQNSVDNTMRVELNSGFAASPAGTTIADGNWHQVAVTYGDAATSVSFYFDGLLYGTGNFSANPLATDITGNLGIAIGAGIREVAAPTGSANRFVNGKIDEVRIYDVQLSGDDVLALYSAVPEPAALALFGLGGLALCFRRFVRRD